MNIVLIAAAKGIDKNGNNLSAAQLQDLARTAVGRSIGVNFNPLIPPIGRIVGARVQDDKLIIEADISDEDWKGYYIAPSYIIDVNTRIAHSLDYALTKDHADENATPIE